MSLSAHEVLALNTRLATQLANIGSYWHPPCGVMSRLIFFMTAPCGYGENGIEVRPVFFLSSPVQFTEGPQGSVRRVVRAHPRGPGVVNIFQACVLTPGEHEQRVEPVQLKGVIIRPRVRGQLQTDCGGNSIDVRHSQAHTPTNTLAIKKTTGTTRSTVPNSE